MSYQSSLILEKVIRLKQYFDDEVMVKTHLHEVHPDLPKADRINYIYFTLPVAINYQRNSPAMWQSALKTYNDPKTKYLFYPGKVIQQSLSRVQTDLLKHKLALQKNKHTQIWIKLCETLHFDFNNDPRQIIKMGNNDVLQIREIVQTKKKSIFPYLSGAKMTNYWLYILNLYTDVKLKNIQMISIIPDTHVMQSSIKLGLTTEDDSREDVAQKWFELLKETGLKPIDMHPVLWNWSRNNFEPEV